VRKHRAVACIVALAVALGSWGGLRAQGSDRRPKLIVLLMVDQMRGDYIDRFQRQWTGGLHRLLTNGAWFRQADYPYLDTVTCAGHASVGTGTMPSTHGMVMNSWWDRAKKVEMPCTADARAVPISYGKAVAGVGDSAATLRTSTLSDELRAQMQPATHIIAFSLKARAAIPMAGHRPDAVVWFDDSGTFVTSTAFTHAPVTAVADYIHRHPVEGDFNKVWDRSLPTPAYSYEDTAIGAHPQPTMTATFPHSLKGTSSVPDRPFYDRWQESPFADEYLARMALDVATHMRVGQGQSTDMIAISFSTLDKVGHDYGPDSHEIQDVLVRLDRTLGEFLSGLDRSVGAGNYLVALSADHGVSPIAERQRSRGLDGGRIAPVTLAQSADQTLQRVFGPGKYVSRVVNGDMYLAAGVFDRLLANPAALASVRRSLTDIPGIAAVFTRDRIAAKQVSREPLGQRVMNSFDPERSGDLIVVVKPYWTIRTDGTGHGSPYGFDTRVPIVLMGKGIVPGEHLAPVSPLDIAPTLAVLAGVTLPRAEGHVLREAFVVTPRRPYDSQAGRR
jgi:predicted AlkP superfamily pyrophosphatase or phosphodiesterase